MRQAPEYGNLPTLFADAGRVLHATLSQWPRLVPILGVTIRTQNATVMPKSGLNLARFLGSLPTSLPALLGSDVGDIDRHLTFPVICPDIRRWKLYAIGV